MAKKSTLIHKRLLKARRVGRILARLPFVRSVILNGSLASGGHKMLSDIDILIIAKTGHIFSARFFVILFALIFRIKRPKDELLISDNQCKKSVNAGKFCFNYFLTENFLTIPTGRGEKMDRYCAQNYSSSRYIAGDIDLYNKFMQANQGLFNMFGCHPERPHLSSSGFRRGSASPRLMTRGSTNSRFRISPLRPPFAKATEVARQGYEGQARLQSGMTAGSDISAWFERWAKRYQIKKIESDPRTKKYPNLIVYNDRELRFHPPSHKLRRTGPPKG